MLSYRHAFHAGNHADILKHWVEVLCIEYLKKKDKPFFYIDTHAGAGVYALYEGYAQKTSEYKDGIGRLWGQKNAPDVFRELLDCVRACNETTLKYYPGSPSIAAQLLRPDDRLRLVEMHTSDLRHLGKNLGDDPRVQVIDGDGFEQIKALLPPPSRRGLVLIDPPYEIKDDYRRVLSGLQEGLKRFATGTYLVWYPLLNANYSQRFAGQLQQLPADNWLNVQLQVTEMPSGHGMYGSGMFVINPPYVLREQLLQGLPWLVQQLAQGEGAEYTLDVSPGA